MTKDERLLEQIVEDWISECMALHGLDIMDTQPGYAGDLNDISAFFRTIGWQWYLDTYGKDGNYIEFNVQMDHWLKWCGAGLASAGVTMGTLGCSLMGYKLKASLAEFVLPSTYRLFTEEFWDKANVPEPDRSEIAPLKRGDVLTFGSKKYGSHIGMFLEDSSMGILCIEFNSKGRNGSDDFVEGVVLRRRKYKEVVKSYRPSLHWFEKAVDQ